MDGRWVGSPGFKAVPRAVGPSAKTFDRLGPKRRPMPPISREAFAAAMGGLSRPELLALIADLWAARGCETARAATSD